MQRTKRPLYFYTLFSMLVCLSLLIRTTWNSAYPTGMDGFHYHDLSNRIIDKGNIWWYYNILFKKSFLSTSVIGIMS